MALLVTDQGEIDSLRTLLNALNIPRNLVLKLYTSNNDPLEADVPTNNDYYEPYDASNASGYGAAPVTGYPEVKNNRTEDQDFTEQYGILLNGNRWTIETTVTAQNSLLRLVILVNMASLLQMLLELRKVIMSLALVLLIIPMS